MDIEQDERAHDPNVDPRDDALGTLCYWHPDSIPLHSQAVLLGSSCADGIEQLVAIDLLKDGLIVEDSDGALRLSPEGLYFVERRLIKLSTWVDYHVRPDAPPLPHMGRRLLTALKTRNEMQRATSPYPFLDVVKDYLDSLS